MKLSANALLAILERSTRAYAAQDGSLDLSLVQRLTATSYVAVASTGDRIVVARVGRRAAAELPMASARLHRPAPILARGCAARPITSLREVWPRLAEGHVVSVAGVLIQGENYARARLALAGLPAPTRVRVIELYGRLCLELQHPLWAARCMA